ncbi:MAG: signal recognition particle-docking protein FtsY [Spirochaetaceae bacterium]|nr:signal recognition particle-docking protein FtsY [Spirochaetaceae bacterium]
MAKLSFKENLKKLFGGKSKTEEDFFESLTDLLIEGDLGAKTAFLIGEELEALCAKKKIKDNEEIKQELRNLLLSYIKTEDIPLDFSQDNVFLILGVNGVGKTTSVAKMANFFEKQHPGKVVIAAADTFRAAAIEQLQYHGEKIHSRVVAHQHGSDPSAVVFDAVQAIHSNGGGLVLADTAGRLHNKENLVRELQKIDRTASSKASENCYKKILVLDSTTGQNALRQAEVFHEAVGIDGVILTKCDSTAKGGVVVCLGKELNVPILYSCFGEGYDHIEKFSPEKYVDEFLG